MKALTPIKNATGAAVNVLVVGDHFAFALEPDPSVVNAATMVAVAIGEPVPCVAPALSTAAHSIAVGALLPDT